MTESVERVPLTDEQLDRLEEASTQFEVFSRNEVRTLLAELRASRAREQEAADTAVAAIRLMNKAGVERDALQQRIDKALAWCHKANPRPDLNGDLFNDLIAALTGTEAIRSMADPDRTVD